MRFKYHILFPVLMTAAVFAEQQKQLLSFDGSDIDSKVELTDARIISNTEQGLMVQTGTDDEWPNIRFKAKGKPWDLRGYFQVKVDVTNAGSSPIHIGLRLDSEEIKDETPQHAQGYEHLEPAETRTISVRLYAEDWVFNKPVELVGMRRNPGSELMKLSAIDRIQVFVGNTTEPHTFIIKNLRAEGSIKKVSPKGFIPFVDEFGQYIHEDWKGKIHSAAEFEKVLIVEAENLKTHPGPDDRGIFGGWTKGPKLEATGFFRTEKVNGKWWLVDPEGLLFWSNGPTCISPGFGYTGIQEREHYFKMLPVNDDPLAQFYHSVGWAPHGFYADKVPFKAFNFYKANLYRKYGEGWNASFINSVHQRLKSWGMNTVANWASPDVYLKQRTPYVANFFIEDNRKLEGSNGYWTKFHDVYDPSFREEIIKKIATRSKEATDPWCIGFFVDNELSWGNDGISLALETLSSPADQPAKQVFVADLKDKYGIINKLNLAWESDYASWKSMLESRELPDVVRAGEDLKRFYAKTAHTYFSTIRDELKKAAPNHLYLGCRFAWVNDVVAVVASEYCDVVSYNKYNHSVRSLHLPHYIDRPIIIGEYHFGATDRGHFHPGLRAADDQKERAEKFKAYVRSGLDNPQLVGVHWFQYMDEHIAGRADGENYNVGLVDVCDTPYPEMVKAMRDVGSTMYEYRMKQN